MLVAQSCPTLFDPMNYTPPGSSVHGILQARILEWVAISFSSVEIKKKKKKSLSEPHWCCGHQSIVVSKAAAQLVLWVENLRKLRFLIPTFHISHWTAISGKEMRVIPNLDPIIPPKPATKSMGFWSLFRAVRGWLMRQTEFNPGIRQQNGSAS